MLPTGLIPKDYRSLKTQYLQVRGPGSHCRARAVSDGGSPPCGSGHEALGSSTPEDGPSLHRLFMSPSTPRLSLQDRPCLHRLHVSPRLYLPLPCACWGALSNLCLAAEGTPCLLPVLACGAPH